MLNVCSCLKLLIQFFAKNTHKILDSSHMLFVWCSYCWLVDNFFRKSASYRVYDQNKNLTKCVHYQRIWEWVDTTWRREWHTMVWSICTLYRISLYIMYKETCFMIFKKVCSICFRISWSYWINILPHNW